VAEDTELAPGAGTEELDPNAPPANEPPAEDGEGDAQPSPYDALARDMGWTPKEEFHGPAESWKSAEQFIRDGRDIQRSTAQELKALRQTVETIGKTSATIVEQEVNRRVADLTDQFNKAVEDGDGKKAYELGAEIQKVQTVKPPVGPPPEAQMFAERNKAWFGKDPLATALAVEVTNKLHTQGYDNATQLDSAEKEVRRIYPHLFAQPKPAPGVHSPGARGPQNNGRAKGFGDMPAEAQKIATDMVSRGVIPDKDAYAKNYWLNAENRV
jgi:hypothetical protein